MKRLEPIQHLRGIAAMLVVFVHFPTPLAQFSGSIGVDIFFFISGFIIFTSIDKSGYHDRPFVFLNKRLLRILPLYWTATTLFILMHVALNQFRFSPNAPHLDTITILKSYLFVPIERNGIYSDPVIFLGWSLNFEMLFYILSFIFLLVFRKNFFIPLVLLLTAMGLTGYLSDGLSNVYLDFLTSPFLLYFSAGLLLGRYQEQVSNFIKPFSEILFFFSFYLLFVVMLGKDEGYIYTGISREKVLMEGVLYPRFIVWGIPAFLFFVSYFSLGKKYNISNRFLNNLGDSSYSVYLLQIFFISIFTLEISYLLNDTGNMMVSYLFMALLVVVSFLSYRYFEKRFHK